MAGFSSRKTKGIVYVRPLVEMLEPRLAMSFIDAGCFGTLGSSVADVAVGDFNNDSHEDFAAASGDGTLMVKFGDGTGQFPSSKFSSAGLGSFSIAKLDFTNDGVLDLVAANSNLANSVVSTMVGNGDGSFQAPVSYPIGPYAFAVTVADFNGDSVLDIAASSSASGGVVGILLGLGGGLFSTPTLFPANGSPFDIVAADFNGDGFQDVAVANNIQKGQATILLGNGDGTFKPKISFRAGRDPDGIAVGDFNHDRVTDLAVANNTSNSVSVLLGKGDGTFLPKKDYAAGSVAGQLAVADIDRDGHDDLVVPNVKINVGEISIFFGRGDGTFKNRQTFLTTCPVTHTVKIGDFNDDDYPDLAIANATEPIGSVSILINAADWDRSADGQPPDANATLVDPLSGRRVSETFMPASNLVENAARLETRPHITPEFTDAQSNLDRAREWTVNKPRPTPTAPQAPDLFLVHLFTNFDTGLN
jgi:hypothetical protein